MAQADAHDRYLGGFHESLKVVDGVLAVSGITRPIRDEDTVEVVCDLVDGVVVWKACHRGPAADKTAEDVLFDTAIDDSHMGVARAGADMEGRLGADFRDEIDLFGVHKGLILILVVLLPNGNACER